MTGQANVDRHGSIRLWLSRHWETGIPWWVGILVLAALFTLPDIAGNVLSGLWLRFPGMDKLAHFSAYMLLFILTYGIMRGWGQPQSESGKLAVTLAICIGVSFADEIQQSVMGHGRTAEYGDVVADMVGALVGLTAMRVKTLGLAKTSLIVLILLAPLTAVTAGTYQTLKHFNRGMVYERGHDYAHAKEEYLLAVSDGYQSPEVFNTIAWLDIEFLNADPAEAEEYAAKAFQLDPDNADILDTYGWVLVRRGRAREGIPFLEKAKALKPSMYCIDLHLGAAYLGIGDRGRAEELLRRQVRLNATDRFGQAAARILADLDRQTGDRFNR